MRSGWLTGILTFAIGSSASGQALTSQASPGQVEIGVFRQFFHRSVRYESGALQTPVWDRVSILARVPLGKTAVLAIDGLAWHRGATDSFPNRDYFDFTFGVGVSVTTWQRGPTSLALNVHYHEQSNLDQSASRYSKRTQQFLVAAVVSRSVRLKRQRADLWAAPALVVDRLFQYPQFYPSDRATSIHNLGAIIGGALLVRGRGSFFGQLTYANYLQGQAGVSLLL